MSLSSWLLKYQTLRGHMDLQKWMPVNLLIPKCGQQISTRDSHSRLDNTAVLKMSDICKGINFGHPKVNFSHKVSKESIRKNHCLACYRVRQLGSDSLKACHCMTLILTTVLPWTFDRYVQPLPLFGFARAQKFDHCFMLDIWQVYQTLPRYTQTNWWDSKISYACKFKCSITILIIYLKFSTT